MRIRTGIAETARRNPAARLRAEGQRTMLRAMRVLHFTDIHLTLPIAQVPLRDWFGKRLLGELNYLVRRRQHFADAALKVARLVEFVEQERVELVLSTGDHTLLGTEPEYELARRSLAPLLAAERVFVHVPGNHDLYLADTVRSRRFERYFGETLRSDCPEYQVDGAWPVVRLLGEEVAVVAVNSAHPNPAPWRASGRISHAQLGSLREIVADARLARRFVFVLTHHAPLGPDGAPDRPQHGLVNAAELLAACTGLHRGAILSGHIHHCYRVPLPGLAPALFNAGSTTYAGREGFWFFDLDGERCRATRGRWNGRSYVLVPEESHAC